MGLKLRLTVYNHPASIYPFYLEQTMSDNVGTSKVTCLARRMTRYIARPDACDVIIALKRPETLNTPDNCNIYLIMSC